MSTLTQVLFWLLAGVVVYTYAGYGVVITLLARFCRRPVRRDETPRPVTLLIAAYNEADSIDAKLRNSLELDYPADQLDILVVTDGSTDETPQIVKRYADRGVRLLHQPERQGKPAAVGRGIEHAIGEVVVFSDANAFLNREALRHLVAPFADPGVGCVAGEKRVLGDGGRPSGEGLYWRYESYLKERDSEFHSVVGAAGELFAVRRDVLEAPPAGLLLDDFVMSMRIAGRGYRVIYEPRAHVSELESATQTGEMERRARNSCGGFQAMWLLRDLLVPRRGRLWFQYVSHRVLRWAVAPLALPLLIALNALLLGRAPYRLLLGAQAVLYGSAVGGLWLAARGVRSKWLLVPGYFVLTNAAALVGLWRYVTGSQAVTWARVSRRTLDGPG